MIAIHDMYLEEYVRFVMSTISSETEILVKKELNTFLNRVSFKK
jgi:hypothetical protein